MADMVREIQGDPDYAAASDRVLLVYESENDPERIAAHLSFLKAQLPEVKVFGMTLLGPLNEEMVLPEQITVCSLLLFQNITASVVSADLSRTSVGAAAAAFTDAVQGAPLKGVMLLTSAQGEQSAAYLDTLAQAFPEVPIFGGQAGAKRLNSEQFYVFDGTQIYLDGAVAVAFCGADLHVHAERVLGWKALGRVHTITKVSDSGAIETIDKKPAMDLYEKYLGLKPDQYFYANNAAFPLLEWTGNSLSARIPFDFTEDGALQMFTPMREGARVSLSYSRKGMLLADAFACAKREAAFKPEAILMMTCLNRRLLLGNADADRELNYYTQVVPAASWGYGGSEILKIGKNGGILNSSIVAAAFREGGAEGRTSVTVRDEKLAHIAEKPMALSDRLVTFLEQTTAELQETIHKFEALARHDQLTGLANRRLLNERTGTLIRQAKAGEGFAALMFDVDFFKKVNDTYGHKAGDAILKEITNVVKAQIRRSDTLGRWGGEEFVCLFENTSLMDATYIAERIRWAVDQHSFAYAGHLTISLGVVAYHPGESEETLFIRLDRMLYQAKNGGRNRVVTEDGRTITADK